MYSRICWRWESWLRRAALAGDAHAPKRVYAGLRHYILPRTYLQQCFTLHPTAKKKAPPKRGFCADYARLLFVGGRVGTGNGDGRHNGYFNIGVPDECCPVDVVAGRVRILRSSWPAIEAVVGRLSGRRGLDRIRDRGRLSLGDNGVGYRTIRSGKTGIRGVDRERLRHRSDNRDRNRGLADFGLGDPFQSPSSWALVTQVSAPTRRTHKAAGTRLAAN
jgi:hypothetical protein